MPPHARTHESLIYNCDHSFISQKNKKPSVRFSLDQNQVRLVPMVSEMTPSEIAASYYNSNDFKKIQSSHRILIRMLRSGRFHADSDGYCFRGVEDDARQEERRLHRNNVKSVLFDWVLHQEGVRDPEDLAENLSKQSRVSMEDAMARAQSDAAEAAMTDDEVSTNTMCRALI